MEREVRIGDGLDRMTLCEVDFGTVRPVSKLEFFDETGHQERPIGEPNGDGAITTEAAP